MSNDESLSYNIDESVSFGRFSEKEMLGFFTHLYGSEKGSEQYYEQQRRMQGSITIGRKPQPGEADVHFLPITSQLDIRIWGHGLDSMETYCFDFVDQKHRPVNTPSGWEIFTNPDARDLMPSQPLLSVEANFGVKEKDILPGEEKYVVPEGLCCRISIPHQADVIVTIPRRVHRAQVARQQSTAT